MLIRCNNQSFHTDTQVKATIKHLKKVVGNNIKTILLPMKIMEKKLWERGQKAKVNQV